MSVASEAARTAAGVNRSFDVLAHGVYNRLGRKLGFYDDLATFARGAAGFWTVQGGAAPPASQLYVKDLFGRLVLASDYLLSKGYVPAWANPSTVTRAEDRVPVAPAPDVAPPLKLDFPGFQIPPLLPSIGDLTGTSRGQGLGTLAIWGFLGVVGVALLLDRRR